MDFQGTVLAGLLCVLAPAGISGLACRAQDAAPLRAKGIQVQFLRVLPNPGNPGGSFLFFESSSGLIRFNPISRIQIFEVNWDA